MCEYTSDIFFFLLISFRFSFSSVVLYLHNSCHIVLSFAKYFRFGLMTMTSFFFFFTSRRKTLVSKSEKYFLYLNDSYSSYRPISPPTTCVSLSLLFASLYSSSSSLQLIHSFYTFFFGGVGAFFKFKKILTAILPRRLPYKS